MGDLFKVLVLTALMLCSTLAQDYTSTGRCSVSSLMHQKYFLCELHFCTCYENYIYFLSMCVCVCVCVCVCGLCVRGLSVNVCMHIDSVPLISCTL